MNPNGTSAMGAAPTEAPEPGTNSTFASVFATPEDTTRFFDTLTGCCAEGECTEHRRERAADETYWRRAANQRANWGQLGKQVNA